MYITNWMRYQRLLSDKYTYLLVNCNRHSVSSFSFSGSTRQTVALFSSWPADKMNFELADRTDVWFVCPEYVRHSSPVFNKKLFIFRPPAFKLFKFCLLKISRKSHFLPFETRWIIQLRPYYTSVSARWRWVMENSQIWVINIILTSHIWRNKIEQSL